MNKGNDIWKKLNILDDAFDDLDMGDVCREPEKRPIKNHRYSLWSDGDTQDAFTTTTAAWDLFEPVNG